MAKATVSLRFQRDFSSVRLAVSTSQSLASPIYSPSYSTTDRVVKISMTALADNTQYYYGVELDGILQVNGRGQFKTFPSSASSFTCAFASCARTGSKSTVFDNIKSQNPIFFIHMGDFHYQDITTNDVGLFRNAYDRVFQSNTQASFYSNIPTIYMWDDHDFGANDSDGTSPSKPAVQQAYKERVPHYSLTATDGSPYQSWVVGRVRFIMTDLMSYKSPSSTTDGPDKTVLGATQKQWFFDQLIKPEPLKIWVSTKSWLGPATNGSDKWNGYATERKEISNFIKSKNLEGRVLVIHGDTHGLGLDDGTNGDFADGGGGKIPSFLAAPLDQAQTTATGTYSVGTWFNGSIGNQYGFMTITDDGTTTNPIVVKWDAKRDLTVMGTLTINVPSAPYSEPTTDTTPPVIIASVEGGTYTSAQTVTLSSNESNTTIYYTTDGSTPTTSSTVYTSPLTISTTTTLKYFGKDSSGNMSSVMSKTYTIQAYYLSMNGTGDYIVMPSTQMDTIEIECSIPTTGQNTYATLLDARAGLTSGHINKSSNVNAGWSTLYVDDVLKSTKLWTDFATGNRVKVKVVATAAFTDNVTFFTSNTTSDTTTFCLGNIYKITCYLSGTIVAQYDMIYGNVQDRSGNGRDATLTGGTWVSTI